MKCFTFPLQTKGGHTLDEWSGHLCYVIHVHIITTVIGRDRGDHATITHKALKLPIHDHHFSYLTVYMENKRLWVSVWPSGVFLRENTPSRLPMQIT